MSFSSQNTYSNNPNGLFPLQSSPAGESVKPNEIVKVNEEIARVSDDLMKSDVQVNNDVQRLFYRVLDLFVGVSGDGLARPLLPVNGVDSQFVDLFRLFMRVLGNGGFKVVQEKMMWGSVIEECRLRMDGLGELVSVYEKYLLEIESRVSGFDGMGGLRDRLMELEGEFNGVLAREVNSGLSILDLDGVECRLNTEDYGVLYEGENEDKCNMKTEDYEKLSHRNDVLGDVGGEKENSVDRGVLVSRKRKHVSLAGNSDEVNEIVSLYPVDFDGIREEDNDVIDVYPAEVDGGENEDECNMKTEDYRKLYHKDDVLGKVGGEKENSADGGVLVSRKRKHVSLAGNSDEENETVSLYSIDFDEIREEDNDEIDAYPAEVEGKCEEENEVPVQVEEVTSQKRKQDSLVEVIRWLGRVAKNPCDPSNGVLPGLTNAHQHEYCKQILQLRKSIFVKLDSRRGTNRSYGQTQADIISLYDDHTSISPKSNEYTDVDPSLRDYVKAVCVGPSHQAEIPELCSLASKSDTKWLGTQVWPLLKAEPRLMIGRDPPGKGRQAICNCRFAGSIQCVRFHINEKRCKLISELGSAFYHWKFDCLGDDVSLPWTEEEERMFKGIVKRKLSAQTNFWDEIYQCFPSKSREYLVSYYYNVFILERRAYQKRHTPMDINSDDDAKTV